MMSPTMILGRVILPIGGILIAGWLLVHAFGGGGAEPSWKALPASLSLGADGGQHASKRA